MAIKFNSVRCPECGADLPIEDGRTQIYCSFCGTRVIITNENEYIFRKVDEAEIKNAEVKQKIQLKKLDIIEKKQLSKQKVLIVKISVSIILGITAIVSFAIGGMGEVTALCCWGLIFMWIFSSMESKDKEDIEYFGDSARIPSGISGYTNKSYSAIEAMFVSAGFTNIKCVPLNDLTMGFLKKPGMVASITVNGNEETTGGKKYPCDASVLITYHSYNEEQF